MLAVALIFRAGKGGAIGRRAAPGAGGSDRAGVAARRKICSSGGPILSNPCGGEARSSALAALPDFGSRVLSASAVIAHVAVGAAAILSRSVTDVAREVLAWVLPRNGKAQQSKE